MYAAIGTQPDQTFSQFMSNPGPAHWSAIKHIFRYLNSTHDLGIIYRNGGEVKPQAYSDADWGEWSKIYFWLCLPNGKQPNLMAIEEETHSGIIINGSWIHGQEPSHVTGHLATDPYSWTQYPVLGIHHTQRQ